MLTNRNDSNNEAKEEKSNALVEVVQKTAASKFDKNLAALIAISLPLLSIDKSDKSILMYIPSDIWLGYILPFLNLEFDFKACRALSYHVDRPLGSFFQSHLRDVRLKQLLQHVVYGNQAEAEKIIKTDPRLLLLRGTVEDYSFGMNKENPRKIEGTAYQMALGADDVGLQNDEVCMAEMIHGYLMALPAGKAKIEKQQTQQFPAKYVEQEKEKNKEDLAALNKVIAIIERASREDCNSAHEVDNEIQKILYGIAPDVYNCDELKKIINTISKADSENDFEVAFDALKNYLYQNAIIKSAAFHVDVLKAIYQFRNYLEPRGVIRTGKHFNVKLLVEAFKLYDKKYERFGNHWDSEKNMLLWQKVIGYIQRFLPACYAQAFVQGIYYIVERREKLKRSLEFCFDNNVFFFPLDSDFRFQLGYVYVCGLGGFRAATRYRDAPFGRMKFLQTYVEQKQHRCVALCNGQITGRRASVR